MMTRMLEPDRALGMSRFLLGCSLGGAREPQKFGEGDESDGCFRYVPQGMERGVWSWVGAGGRGLSYNSPHATCGVLFVFLEILSCG